jgi:hypothetical protein
MGWCVLNFVGICDLEGMSKENAIEGNQDEEVCRS